VSIQTLLDVVRVTRQVEKPISEGRIRIGCSPGGKNSIATAKASPASTRVGRIAHPPALKSQRVDPIGRIPNYIPELIQTLGIADAAAERIGGHESAVGGR
jgi:hypothetical protein